MTSIPLSQAVPASNPRLTTSLLLLITTLFAGQAAAQAPFEGYWVLNYEETDKVAIKYEDGSGVGKKGLPVDVSVDLGLGLPLPRRFRQAPMSNLSPKDPLVLRSQSMEITDSGKRIKLLYDHQQDETLVTGDYRGRQTSKSKKRIQQKYKTPDRKVTKTWEMRDDGRMLVTVKLNPRGDKARTYKRVFERAEKPAAADATNNPPADTPAS